MATKLTNKELFCKELSSVDREGIEDLLEYMDDCGFFTSPCSGSYHLAKEGGLLEHSLNVLEYARRIAVALYGKVKKNGDLDNSIIIAALLHDLGKMGQFGKENYIPNMIKSKKKNPETGEYDMVQSESKPYTTNPDLLPIDHEIRSITIATMFIDLTEEEQFAILYHNGLYGNLKYALNGKETPLYMIIHFADLWCSRVIEKEDKND